MTGKFLELVDMLKKRKVDVVCIQKTKWKSGSTKEANGFKLWYLGVGNTRNGVGITISSLMKENVVKVNGVNNMIMKIKLVVNEEVVNIVSVYAPHVGLSELARKNFWDCMDEIVRELLCCQDDEQVDMRRILYKEVRRTAKKTVAEAKSKAYEAMYNHLGTKEGQNGIYRLAKVKERRRRDLGFVKCIKDVNGHVLVKDNDIQNR
ncbi:hypothetical protein AgCh_026560 [Apium graveolens]